MWQYQFQTVKNTYNYWLNRVSLVDKREKIQAFGTEDFSTANEKAMSSQRHLG